MVIEVGVMEGVGIIVSKFSISKFTKSKRSHICSKNAQEISSVVSLRDARYMFSLNKSRRS